jgi:glutathione synthase/RimK-type ligase-like ATP-grasp enzyme
VQVALVTCREMPREDNDLPLLAQAFAARGARAQVVAWEDAGVDWRAFDVALVRSTWNYVAHYREFRAWIDLVSNATRLLNPREALVWNLHKRYLRELADAGIDVVPTELVLHGCEPDWSALFDRFGDIVVKPAVSAGSFATVRVREGDVAAARAHRAAHLERDLLVQPLLASVVAHGETNLVHLGGRFSHAIHKGARWAGDSEQARGCIGATDAELALARRILAHVDARGFGPLAYARVDVAASDDGSPLLMELEIVEPSLYLPAAPEGAGMLADAVLSARA